jgi:hypothetical protein
MTKAAIRCVVALFIPAALALGLISCAMGGGDALDQLFESEDTLFVAGGENNTIYASRDGIVWLGPLYSRSSPGSFLASTYGSRGFVVAGLNPSSHSTAAVSADGLAWMLAYDSASIAPTPRGLFHAGGTYFMAADQGIFVSRDGATWSQALASATILHCIARRDDLMIAAGSTAVYASLDGINWIQTAAPSSVNLNDAICVDGTFYLVGNESGNNAIFASVDGATATGNLITPYANEMYGIAHGNGAFAAVGENGYVWVSTNGAAWSRLYPAAAGGNSLLDVAYAKGRFVAVYDTGLSTGGVIYSDDGYNWLAAQPPAGGFPALNTVTVRP